MTHAFSSLDELGNGPGFRKVRGALDVTAFGVNGVVYPPNYEGISHYHDTQDELYFVHSGTAKVHVEGEERILGPGGLFHVQSTTPRRIESVSGPCLRPIVRSLTWSASSSIKSAVTPARFIETSASAR